MKRSDFFIRLTTLVLFLAVAAYIGISIFNTLTNTLDTIPAISYSVEETFPANGFVVRTEMVLREAGRTVLPTVADGVRVSRNQPIAVEYLTSAALETAGEIRSLRMRISQLEAAEGGRMAVEASRLESVMDLSMAVHSGNLSRLDEMSVNIETLIFDTESPDELGLAAMRSRLELLERRSEGVRTFYAPYSGTFSQVIDGFEHISPEDLTELMPSQLEALFENPSRTTGVGKLVTAFKWYFVSVMSQEDASRLSQGRQVTLQFSGAFHSDKLMRVESIGRADDYGMSVVVFSSDRGVHEIVHLRELRAEVVFDIVTGIRLPKEAIRLDDDGTLFIFIQTGVRAERVNVEILKEYEDIYLIPDGLHTGSPLRPGSTIIVRGNNLYHGRVVG